MAGKKQAQEEIRRNLIDNLSWQAAQRDDERVAQAIHEGKELDAVYSLDEVGLLDGFFHFPKHLIFVVIAKSNMLVRKDALALAAQVPPDKVATRTRTVRHGHGRKQTTEELVTRLVGLKELTSYGLYGPEEYTQHYRRKDYAANPINAVVVLEWDSKKKGNRPGRRRSTTVAVAAQTGKPQQTDRLRG